MSKKIFEENSSVGPHRGHAAGATDIEKAASQLVSDVKYKVNKEMKTRGGRGKMNPAQVAQAYIQQLAASRAKSPVVKALAKKKLMGLMGENYTSDISQLAEETVVNAMMRVFVEGIEKDEEYQDEYLLQLEEIEDRKYKIRVTDKKTGNTYVRMATREKIAELRANPNISSVEMTEYGEISSSEASKGSQTAAAKAGKDYDEDGTVESPAKEYRGAVHNAIQRRTGGKPDGKDTSSVKEEFLTDASKRASKRESEGSEKKIDIMKGSNNVVINPPLGESSIIEKKMTKSEKEKEAKLKSKYDPSGTKASMISQYGEKKGPKVYFAFLRKKAIQNASYEPQGSVIEEGDCGCEDNNENKKDPRSIKTNVNNVKNKLRAMGLNMSYEPEGEMVGEAQAIGKARSTDTNPRGASVRASSGRGMTMTPARGLGASKLPGDDKERAAKQASQAKKDRRSAAKDRAASGEDSLSKLINSVRNESYRTTASGNRVRWDENDAIDNAVSDRLQKQREAANKSATKAKLASSGKLPIKKKPSA